MKLGDFLTLHRAFHDVEVLGRLPGGGGWNESWLVSRGRERLVVRLDTPAVAGLGLDRAAELAALRAVAGKEIGPEIVWSSPGQGVLVTRWLAGRAVSPVMFRNPRLLRALGGLLRRMHETVALPGNEPALDLGRAMSRYAEIVGGARARRMAVTGTRAWRESRPDERAAAVCHNDPVAPNVIAGRGLRLIDWEFSCPGDPLFDLAVVIGHHGLNDRQARILLAAGRNGVRIADRKALERLVEAYGCLRSLWELAVRRLRQAGSFA